jgi:hypothetical protein
MLLIFKNILLQYHSLTIASLIPYEDIDLESCAGIFKQSLGARNRVGVGIRIRDLLVGSGSFHQQAKKEIFIITVL